VTNIHVPGGIRSRNPSKRAAADVRLRPRGHRDQPLLSSGSDFIVSATSKLSFEFEFVVIFHGTCTGAESGNNPYRLKHT